jgi:hypothetical protein
MFGAEFGAKDAAREPGRTEVGNEMTVGKEGKIDEIVGTEGVGVANGDVVVANRSHVEGEVGSIVGRKMETNPKDDKDV